MVEFTTGSFDKGVNDTRKPSLGPVQKSTGPGHNDGPASISDGTKQASSRLLLGSRPTPAMMKPMSIGRKDRFFSIILGKGEVNHPHRYASRPLFGSQALLEARQRHFCRRIQADSRESSDGGQA